jgi:RNA polymerase sigma factor (sigma-70 family)
MPFREGEKFLSHFLGESAEEATFHYKEFLPTLKYLADKGAMLSRLDSDDLLSEGTIGLARAFREFNAERSLDFRIFAIHKIKDAIREFITSQATNLKAPQYLKDAIILLDQLKRILEKRLPNVNYFGLSELWRMSENLNENTVLDNKIQFIRRKIAELANRSAVRVEELIIRAELIPVMTEDPDSTSDPTTAENVEDHLIDSLDAHRFTDWLKANLRQDEYELLLDRFVAGWTIRQLEEKMGVRASTIVIRTNKIIEKIRKLLRPKKKSVVSELDANLGPVLDEEFMSHIKKYLSARGFDLLCRFAVEGESVENISEDIGMTSEEVKNDLEKIAAILSVIMEKRNGYETSFDIKKAEAGQ